jgi:predicted dehydrogenase
MSVQPILGSFAEQTQTKPIRLGLLGLNFGESIARKIAQSVDCLKVVAVCEIDQTKLHRVARGLGVKAYGELDGMLDDPEIEAVAVFSGSSGRARLISKILQRDRHVLTTKPFELEVAEAEQVLLEAQERRLVVHLNSPGPESPEDISTIQNWREQYDLGRPLAFHAKTWSNYREQPNSTWYDDPEKCAAAPILRLGIYFLNEFACFMGKPRSVHVVQSRIFTKRPTSDHAHMTIEFENGSIGSVFASFCIEDGHPWRDEISLNFERGTVNRWVERHSETDMSKDYAVTELWKKGMNTIRSKTSSGSFAGWYQWEAFQRAIRQGEGMNAKYAHDILYGIRLLEAMRLSAISGKTVPVNL